MIIPNEFMIGALRKEVTSIIIPAPQGKRVFRQGRTEHIVADGNSRAGRTKYGIVNVFGAKYKNITDLIEDDVQPAGHQSIESFLSWWGARNPNYNMDDRVAIINFELVAVEKFGLRLMEGKIKAGDRHGKKRTVYYKDARTV